MDFLEFVQKNERAVLQLLDRVGFRVTPEVGQHSVEVLSEVV